MCCIMGLIYSKFSSYFFPACTIQFKWACPKNTPNRPLCCKTIDTVLAPSLFNSSFKFQFVPSLTTQGRHRAPFHMQICGIEREPAARCRIEAGISRVAIMWRTTTTLPSALLDIASLQLITQMYIVGANTMQLPDWYRLLLSIVCNDAKICTKMHNSAISHKRTLIFHTNILKNLIWSNLNDFRVNPQRVPLPNRAA